VTPSRPWGPAPVSAAQAVEAIESGQRVFVHGAAAYPRQLVEALVGRAGDLRGVELVHMFVLGPAPHTDPEHASSFRHRAIFVGDSTRRAIGEGRASYVPVFLSDTPRLVGAGGGLPVDAALVHVSPPDRHGFCSLGTSVDFALAAVTAARIRIAQVNPRMPRTHGEGIVHVDDFTALVAVDEPLPEVQPRVASPSQRAIGEHVAALVPNGATVQVGIGGIPDAVLAALSGHREIGIHSELISDGVLDLIERGVVTGSRKSLNRGKVVASFLMGTRRLYDFVDDNPFVQLWPIDYVNDTHLIRQLDDMVAVNSALEIDLTGQVCADSMGPAIYSGVGGQMDFMRGAALARRGKPIIALPATARGGSVSRIVPTLPAGSGVTTTRAHVHWVVTEHGAVNLHGKGLDERARALIGLAEPCFRDGLEKTACALHLI
jgi:acyl-CoA hydrolase